MGVHSVVIETTKGIIQLRAVTLNSSIVFFSSQMCVICLWVEVKREPELKTS